MHFVIATVAVVAVLVAAEPSAKPQPEPQPQPQHAGHGFAKRWSGYGAWGCSCPIYGGFGYGAGIGYGAGVGYGVGTGIHY
ncbi:hypothetical protein GGH95_002555 [Coemansia sp. RSA 1836]|nr:hypothetical protein GGH95_002555 [Coemansia sp. RSA 1836]